MSKEKSRNFTFLLYPESLPEDWEIKLESLDVPIAISPLHDKDLKEEGRTNADPYKKPHYHVIYIAKNPVTADSVRKKVKGLLGDKSLAKVQIVHQGIGSMYAYLTHESKDAVAKNKHVYAKKDIKHLNNFDIDRYVTLDVEDKKELFNLLLSLIKAYSIANMFDLIDFVDQKGDEYGLPSMDVINDVIVSKTGIIKMYFEGAYHRSKRGGTMRKFD